MVDGQKVIGTLNTPDGVSKPPVVLLLHGFTGSRNELEIPAVKEGIFSRAAKAWADKGMASLRIDFRGNGQSEGEFEDMTMEGLMADAEAALDYLAASPDVDKDRMAIVGWSMGGAVAASVAGRTEYDLDAVSALGTRHQMGSSLALLVGPESMKAGMAAKDVPATMKMPWGAEVSSRPVSSRASTASIRSPRSKPTTDRCWSPSAPKTMSSTRNPPQGRFDSTITRVLRSSG